MLRIINEGILTDIYDMATTAPESHGDYGNTVVDTALKPLKSEDLFDAIVDQLKGQQTYRTDFKMGKTKMLKGTQHTSNATKQAAEEFFPEDGKIPMNTHPDLYKAYKYEFENIIINFITKGAVDIITKVQNAYREKQGKAYDPKSISWQTYLGTILTYMWQPKYNLIKDIGELWKKYKEDKKSKKWNYKGDPNKNASKNSTKLYKDAIQLAKDSKMIPSDPKEAEVFQSYIRNASGKTAEEIFTNGLSAYANRNKK